MSLALWCVLAMAVMPYLVVGFAKMGPGLDNDHPRDWALSLKGIKKRAHAAHLNCFEAFPFFAAGIVIAQMLSVHQPLLDALAAAFVAVRVLYVALYLANFATLRSLVWSIGFFICLALFVAAGFQNI